MSTRVAVIYYSATGNVHALARAVAQGAEGAEAEVRLRHVEELASELIISQNQYWGRHRSQVAEAPVATLADLDWAEGIAFGTPTRFGNVAAQLKQFIDQAGTLWQEGKLADKVATTFTSSQTAHGGQETTILALNNTLYHWGMIILPLGYTVHEVFAAGGNPYGSSFVAGHTVTGPDESALALARYQGQRLARYAAAIAEARRAGAFDVKRPSPELPRWNAPRVPGASKGIHEQEWRRERNVGAAEYVTVDAVMTDPAACDEIAPGGWSNE
jgi:NAD(P)H dehydrogenase (quinone)